MTSTVPSPSDRPDPDSLWPALERSLQSGRDGRLVLAEFARDAERGGTALREWLRGPGAELVTVVSGGTVERLVNIARAEAVHIYHGAAPIPVPRQLPSDIASFTDRADVVDSMRRTLAGGVERPPVIAIAGLGGVGKTSLAVRVGRLTRDMFPGGQLYIDLRGQSEVAQDPADVLAGFIRAFGIEWSAIPPDLDERAALYRSVLGERRVLTLLDNARDEAQLRALLPGEAGSAAIVTSRRPLAGLDGVQHLELTSFSETDSVAMLSNILGEGRCRDESDAARRIGRLCGGLPLALSLAGAKLTVSELTGPGGSLSALAAALLDERKRLRELRVGDREVRAILKLSYDRRPDAEQRLFRLLALLDVDSVAPWVAASLVDTTVATAQELIEGLVENRLLIAVGQGRYRFHDLMRALATELVETMPERERRAAIGRVLDDFCALAESHARRLAPGGYFEQLITAAPAARLGAVDGDPYQWFNAEFAVIRWAVDRAADGGWPGHAWRLALALQDYLELQGNLRDWRDIAQRGVEAALANRRADAVALARRSLGIVLLYQGDTASAIVELRQALPPPRRRVPSKSRAVTLRSLGEALSEAGEWDDATRCFDEAGQVFAELGLAEWAAWTLWSHGVSLHVRANSHAAVMELRECLGRFEHLHHPRGLAVVLRSLSTVELSLGHHAEAMSSLEQCMPLFRSTGDLLGEALASKQLAELYQAAGRDQEAAALLELCDSYLQHVGSTDGFR